MIVVDTKITHNVLKKANRTAPNQKKSTECKQKRNKKHSKVLLQRKMNLVRLTLSCRLGSGGGALGSIFSTSYKVKKQCKILLQRKMCPVMCYVVSNDPKRLVQEAKKQQKTSLTSTKSTLLHRLSSTNLNQTRSI